MRGGRCIGTGMATTCIVVRWGLGTVQLRECFYSIHHSFFFRKGRRGRGGREGARKSKWGGMGEKTMFTLQILYSFFVSLWLPVLQ